MANQVDSAKPDRTSREPIPGTFRFLQIVIGAAFVLATLFTAWTPTDKPASAVEEYLSFSGKDRPTALPAGDTTPTPRPRPRIGVVAGHWGNDSGAVCPDGLTESEVNLNIAVLTQRILVARGLDVDVLQEFDPLLDGYQANALVSIHADSCDYVNDEATGYKVASTLASERPERASRLTACIRNRYEQATGLSQHHTSVTDDMTFYHAFGEIDKNTTAAIIETGFLNLDRQFLTEHADQAAQGIAEGILCYINNESISPLTPQPNP